MIPRNMTRHDLDAFFRAQIPDHIANSMRDRALNYLFSVFGNPYQVKVNRKYGVRTMSVLHPENLAISC